MAAESLRQKDRAKELHFFLKVVGFVLPKAGEPKETMVLFLLAGFSDMI